MYSSSLDAAGVSPSSSAVCNNYYVLLTVQLIRSIIIMIFKDHDMGGLCIINWADLEVQV